MSSSLRLRLRLANATVQSAGPSDSYFWHASHFRHFSHFSAPAEGGAHVTAGGAAQYLQVFIQRVLCFIGGRQLRLVKIRSFSSIMVRLIPKRATLRTNQLVQNLNRPRRRRKGCNVNVKCSIHSKPCCSSSSSSHWVRHVT